LITSQAVLDAFAERINTRTYSKCSSHKTRPIDVPLKRHVIDWSSQFLVVIVASQPFAEFTLDGVERRYLECNVTASASDSKALSAPVGLKAFSAWVIGGHRGMPTLERMVLTIDGTQTSVLANAGPQESET